MAKNDVVNNVPRSGGYGLLYDTGTPVPLKNINVDIKIIDFVAEVTAILQYSNNEDSVIEAEFTFPVDDSSAVFRFDAEIRGRHIVAEIQEKEQAKLTYKDAIERGTRAMLLAESDDSGDIFQCTLGNLPPNSEANVRVSYVTELPQEPDGKLRFTLPTVLNPRYSADAGTVKAADRANYSLPACIPYTFSMAGSIKGYHRVQSVSSVYDNIKVEVLDENSAKISLAEDFRFDHDLSFLVEYENCYMPQAVFEMGNPTADGILKEDMLMVSFNPDLKETTTHSGEYIFIIDRSGSMRGNRIKSTREALLLFLKSLPAGCYFNVISFGSSYSSLFKFGSGQYNKSNLKDALKLLRKIDADMGGTEMYKPLKHALGKKIIKGHHRQIFILTDGEIENTEEIIGLVKSNAHHTRVFAIGIGFGASSSLINGLARAGNGKAEFIYDKDRIQSKVVSLLKLATQPAITNVDVKWEIPNGTFPVTIPAEPPSTIGLGERLCLFALLKGNKLNLSDRPCSVSLSGQYGSDPVDFKIKFKVPLESETVESAPLHRLAAKKQIKLLESEECELAYKKDFADGESEGKMAEIRQKMILVSQNANIVSKLTAFVATDKEAGKCLDSELVKRSCPVPVASLEFSWGLLYYTPQEPRILYKSSGGIGLALISKVVNVFSRKSRNITGDEMLEMVMLQEIEGHWKFSEEVTSLLKVDEQTLKSCDVSRDLNVVITMAVIVWLRSNFADRHDEWELIESKALTWLRLKIAEETNLDLVLESMKIKLWPGSID